MSSPAPSASLGDPGRDGRSPSPTSSATGRARARATAAAYLLALHAPLRGPRRGPGARLRWRRPAGCRRWTEWNLDAVPAAAADPARLPRGDERDRGRRSPTRASSPSRTGASARFADRARRSSTPAAMVVRYAVRMRRRPGERWFGGAIPIVFHRRARRVPAHLRAATTSRRADIVVVGAGASGPRGRRRARSGAAASRSCSSATSGSARPGRAATTGSTCTRCAASRVCRSTRFRARQPRYVPKDALRRLPARLRATRLGLDVRLGGASSALQPRRPAAGASRRRGRHAASARAVVVATGRHNVPHAPGLARARATIAGALLHSVDYRSGARVRGRAGARRRAREQRRRDRRRPRRAGSERGRGRRPARGRRSRRGRSPGSRCSSSAWCCTVPAPAWSTGSAGDAAPDRHRRPAALRPRARGVGPVRRPPAGGDRRRLPRRSSRPGRVEVRARGRRA